MKTTHWSDTMFYGYANKVTSEQTNYLNAMQSGKKKLIISNSKAGSGKTTLAVMMAKYLGMPLLYVFNPTEENKMGFRPGNQPEKEKEYLQPLKDALREMREDPTKAIFNEETEDETVNANAWVYAQSHTFARGTNKKGMFIIIDEAQNWTVAQLKKMLTRIHDDCIVVVIGHTGQIDLDDPSQSGFEHLIYHFQNKAYVALCPLTKNFRGILANDADEM